MDAGLLAILKPFLPCTEDYQTLRVMSDICEEQGELSLAKHLRWTANEWEWKRGLLRRECKPNRSVWARYSSQGWSRATIIGVTDTHVAVEFPHRDNWTSNGKYQQAKRAWWDLEPRGESWLWEDRSRRKAIAKPQPRKGYGTGKNAKLAAFLTGNARMMRVAEQDVEDDGDFVEANFGDLELFKAAMQGAT